jgi:hypothetical protein
MKKNKILIASVVLFLVASVNMASAQNDSIYGLEVSKENKTISFYSTYDMTNAKQICTFSYDGASDNLLWRSTSYRNRYDLNSISFYEGSWIWVCEKITEDIYKVNVQSADLMRYLIPEDKPTRIELWIEGEGFISPTPGSAIGGSNVLIFYYHPTIETSLTKLETDENYTYKYFLLSGIESKTKPVGVPFIRRMYYNGILISTDKRIELIKQ